MIKLFSSIWIFFLCISSSFAESLPTFPMTIYGTLQVGTASLWAGAKLSFYDTNNAVIGTYTTTRDGWYGYDSTIAGASPIFSGFTGALRIGVEYQSKTYTISSIAGSTNGCPVSSTITFVSTVCRYDIVTIAPIVPSSSSSSVGGGSSSYVAPIIVPQTNTDIIQSSTWITSSIKNKETISSLPINKDPIVVTSKQAKKSNTIITQTTLKKWTNIIVYRILNNWRKIQAGKTRVLPNGKIRFTTKIAGKYILVQK